MDLVRLWSLGAKEYPNMCELSLSLFMLILAFRPHVSSPHQPACLTREDRDVIRDPKHARKVFVDVL